MREGGLPPRPSPPTPLAPWPPRPAEPWHVRQWPSNNCSPELSAAVAPVHVHTTIARTRQANAAPVARLLIIRFGGHSRRGRLGIAHRELVVRLDQFPLAERQVQP